VKVLVLFAAIYAPDAHAWGLQTHLFFAHYALGAVALADPELRAAAARFPRLVLAGACLPDLAVVGRFFLRTPDFLRAHRWATLRRMAAAPRSDEHRALVLGYATHLLADVVAHNHFVPQYEARIGRGAMVAHLVAEWAMDRHVDTDLQPGDTLEEAGWHAVQFVAQGFRCGEILSRRAIDVLARGERLLRGSPLPALCRKAVGLMDRDWDTRFELYLRRTMQGLANIETALSGGFEDWCGSDPEGSEGDGGADRRAREHIARVVQAEHHARSCGEQCERREYHREPRVVPAGDQRESHRVKRVA
jgi:hypothetical protein